MKIQDLAIIFIIIILPISILLAEYTQFQIKTLNTQSRYDAKLTAATYDAIKAFQLNALNSTTDDLANSKLRDLEASVATFRNSIQTSFELAGYTEDELNNYIPALVYTLYDGFYIYSPYKSTHDEFGNKVTGEQEGIYGLKPYISYSVRYKYPLNVANPSIDVVITYSLDNYVTVQGQINYEYVNKGGYLIDNISVSGTTVKYNGIPIEAEHLKEGIGNKNCSYAKINGTKYYLMEDFEEQKDKSMKDCIVFFLNGELKISYREGDAEFYKYKEIIENNTSAKQYYIQAYEFTKWFKETVDLDKLKYENAHDEVINEDGTTHYTQIWPDNEKNIFDSSNIENELSNFNQHRLAVIRHKIENNLAIAIANYNAYSDVSNVFQMPELKENEWDQITHNICLISFLQGLPIGGKLYNGYTLVTNSESEEVVLEENIYILGYDSSTGGYYYHKINDIGFSDGTSTVNAANYFGNTSGITVSAGRLNLDFKRNLLLNTDNSIYYYYPLKQYNASYDSVVMQDNIKTYDDIYKYVNTHGNNDLKIAFYTALGRERFSIYRPGTTMEDIFNMLAP